MSDYRQEVGRRGEKLAADFLAQAGYKIVTTNWHCSHGEIDIVALKEDEWVFVEVRSRQADSTETAFESINPRKQATLKKLAFAYLSAHKIKDAIWRIDVIAVALPRNGEPIIEHVEDALGW
jgi:putative endonuclease